MSDFDFCCDYAKSDRSTCRGSKEKIPKGSLRMGKMVQSPNFDGKIEQWYLFDVFFKNGTMGCVSVDQIKGFDSLRNDDQNRIREKLGLPTVGGASSSKSSSESSDKKAPAKGRGRKRTKKDADDEEEEEEKKDEAEPEPKKQKTKEELEKEKADEAWTKENEYLWGIKDKLKELKTAELKEFLTENNTASAGGRDSLIERAADLLAYGVGPKCDSGQCPDSVLYFSYGERKWKCPNKLEWGRCLNTKELDEAKTKKPEMIDSSSDWFNSFKFKARKRVLRAVSAAPSAEEKKKTLLSSFCVVFLTPDEDLEKKIQEHGGQVKTRVTKEVSHLIAKEEEYDAEAKGKVATAQKHQIPVVPPSFIQKILETGILQDEGKSRLDRESNTDKKEVAEEEKQKRIVKGGYAVDPDTKLDLFKVSIYKKKEDGYDVMLNLADVISGRNSYYALQVIVNDDASDGAWVFKKWGRVGTDIGDKRLIHFDSVEEAIEEFEQVFLDKTGNEWEKSGKKSKRDKFVKQPKLMIPINLAYEVEGDQAASALSKLPAKVSSSRLDSRVQSLMGLIFDLKIMEGDLLEMKFDLKKMPLGNLTKDHIKQGYDTLTEINDIITGKVSVRNKEQSLMQLTNKFFSIIPHDFGMKAPELITTMEVLQSKIKMMESLMDIEIAAQFLKLGDGGGKSEVDTRYEALKTSIIPLEKDTEDFKWINEYVTNTKVAGYNKWPGITVAEAFRVEREGEYDRFEKVGMPIGNRFILYHGSRISNYGGILSQGLRIAPPSAPVSGYRFGKGIYAADCIAKSANYCRSQGSEYMLIMLCEVAMGKIWETKQDAYMEEPKKGFNSTKALGQYQPKVERVLPDGASVPCGKPENTKISSSCDVNEYIVYDMGQVRIKYLLKLHCPF